MSERCPALRVIIALCLLLCVGCTTGAQGRLAGAPAASVFSWQAASLSPQRGARGEALEGISVRGGEVIRIVVASKAPVEIAELRAVQGGATESWLSHQPEAGVIYLRASRFTSAIAARPGVLVSVSRGRVEDPGYGWFKLEDQALAWASAPLKTPFPELARGERIELLRFEAFDDAWLLALSGSASRDRDRRSILALRRVLALRAVRELRPLQGLPYFYLAEPTATGKARRFEAAGRTIYAVAPQASVTFALEGPSLFELSATGDDSAGDDTLISVTEGERERARVVAPGASSSGLAHGAGTRRRLPGIRLHIPPGHHDYTLLSSEPIEVRGLSATAAVHFEDARAKSEAGMLELAERSCDEPATPGLCLMTLALLGRDAQSAAHGAALTPGTLDYAGAWTRSNAAARELAASISRGAPLTRSDDASATASLRESAWSVVADANPDSWSANLSEPGEPACAQDDAASDWQELDATPRELATNTWHGAPALELVVAARCDGSGPVELEVDGQRLRATPAAGLVHWHIRTRGDTARVSRLDQSGAHVYAARTQQGQCRKHWGKIRGPRLASSLPKLDFLTPGAPGAEVWLRDGAASSELSIRSREATAPAAELRVVVASKAGFSALDPQGTRWTRVARIALPSAWAHSGVSVEGGKDVAVRALVRSAKPASGVLPPELPADEAAAVEADVERLTALSAQLLTRPAAERGALYLERGLLLASSGALRGALADARAADALGSVGRRGELASVAIRAAIRVRSSKPSALPADVAAFGVEPDFDAEAVRCGAGSGPRATFERTWQELREKVAGDSEGFDPALAARALGAAEANSSDPRASSVRVRALAGSRFRELKAGSAALPRHRHEPPPARGPVEATDVWGELRPAVASGGLLQEGTFVVVDADHPASARLAGTARGTQLRLELLCYAKEPAAPETCSPDISLEGAAGQTPRIDSGLQVVTLSVARGGGSLLTLAVPHSAARWTLLARIVVDRRLPGAQQVEGVGWVLLPKPHEYRFELDPPRSFTLDAPSARIVRLEAYATAESEVVAELGGDPRPLPGDGTPTVLVLPPGSTLRVRVVRGAASLAAAERVPADAAARPAVAELSRLTRPAPATLPAAAPRTSVALRFDELDELPAGWHADAAASPAPLSRLEDNLGTAVATSGAVLGNVRNHGPVGSGTSAYIFTKLGYRRRIEALGLTGSAAAFSRVRQGDPTYGAEGSLYWDLSRIHTRLSSSSSFETERVLGIPSRALRWRGFAEYSYRAAPKVFVLPRLGWDLVDVSLAFRPSNLVEVDDDIYDPYRARRPLFVFAQALLWYTPHFDDIFYLRLRATENTRAGVFSHASLRPGAFTVLGNLDLAANADLTWYAASDSRSGRASSQQTLSASATYDAWFGLGSLDVAPSLSYQLRPSDGAYQIAASVTLLGSFRRGLRDFTSLELDFPEQRAGGVPWRGADRSSP